MYCGNCFRDNALVTEFRRSGHDALMIPLYLPLTLDEANQSEGTPIFFGGLNVYLSQKFKLFRKTPRWFRKLFNAGFIMRSVGKMAGKTRGEDVGLPILKWGGIEKTLGDFKLETGQGEVKSAEVVGVVGPNATGKTTLVKIIAGEMDPDEGWCTMDAKVSYKPQHVSSDFEGTVQDWLDTELGNKWRGGEFNTQVIRALQIDKMLELRAKKLSGGELQAVSIAICLGKDADLYLLDEPSAHLDANARMEAAKAIRRTMESNEKAAMVIDHDIYFIDIVSDSLLVFEGEGGQNGSAIGPLSLRKGMNRFLSGVGVTFRRDHDSHRPRINKTDSVKDREQKASGEYFYAE